MQEIWKDCTYGIKGHYQVSNLGRVKSSERIVKRGSGEQKMPEKLLKTRIDENGYEFLGLYVGKKKQVFKKVHTLVAEAFLENNENKKCVNHKNAIKNDNRCENLEWVTYKENTAHAVKNNLMKPPKGENHPFSVLSSEDVILIREMKKDKKSNREISKNFNVCVKTVYNIVNRKSWSHI